MAQTIGDPEAMLRVLERGLDVDPLVTRSLETLLHQGAVRDDVEAPSSAKSATSFCASLMMIWMSVSSSQAACASSFAAFLLERAPGVRSRRWRASDSMRLPCAAVRICAAFRFPPWNDALDASGHR